METTINSNQHIVTKHINLSPNILIQYLMVIHVANPLAVGPETKRVSGLQVIPLKSHPSGLSSRCQKFCRFECT